MYCFWLGSIGHFRRGFVLYVDLLTIRTFINYETHGSGPTIILLHGLGGNLTRYAGVRTLLKIGADGWGKDAIDAVQKSFTLVGEK